MSLLDEIWSSISQSTPKVLLAVLLLVVGWVLARIVSKGIFVLLARTSIDDWASRRLGIRTGGKYGHRVERIVARSVFYALLLVVAILVLNTLELEPVTQPLINLVDTIVAALPNVLLAIIIVLIAFVVGKIVGFSLTKAMQAARVDERLSRVVGIEKVEDKLSQTIGDLAFWFILVVGVIQGLDALQMSSLVGPLQGALNDLAGILPNLLAAVLISAIGLLLARFTGRLAANLLSEVGFDRFVARIGLVPAAAPAGEGAEVEETTEGSAAAPGPAEAGPGETPEAASKGAAEPPAEGGREAGSDAEAAERPPSEPAEAAARAAVAGLRARRTPSEVAGMIAAVIIGLLVLSQALSILELNRLASLVDSVIAFLPDLGVAAVIVIAGLWAGNSVKRRFEELYPSHDEGLQRFLGAAARLALLIFATAMALQQIGVAPNLIVTAFAILFGAVCLAMALAFGLGGRDVAGEIVRKGYDEYGGKPPRAARRKK